MPSKKKKENSKCKYAWEDYKCSRQALPGDEHCFFHSKDIEGKKDKFDKKFWEDEFEKQKKDGEKYDFTGFVFPGDIQFKEFEFEKDICFKGAKFSGEVDFSGAQFSGKANFMGTQFFGLARFQNAIFSYGAEFWITQFHGIALFKEAEFYNTEAHFNGSKFFEETNFKEAKFKGGSYFGSAKFFGDAHFREAKFFETSQFHGANFYRKTDFNNAHFTGGAYFNEVNFFEYVDLYNIEFEVKSFSFKNTYFFDVRGLDQFINKNKEKFKPSKKNPKLEILSEDFRLILGEKATAKHPVISRKIRDDMYLFEFQKLHPCKYKIWQCLANCGRKFRNLLIWCIVSVLIPAVIYGCFPSAIKQDNIDCFLSYVYYSIVTFSTLGFGDIVPLKLWMQLIAAFQVLLGYIMLGSLISILANKLARRS